MIILDREGIKGKQLDLAPYCDAIEFIAKEGGLTFKQQCIVN